MESVRNNKDTLSKTFVLLYHLQSGRMDTLSCGGNDFRGFVFDEDGNQLAYVAERDADPKALQKFYKLWYYKAGMDSAEMLLNRNSVGMRVGMTVSENGSLSFSKSGRRLFFGVAPIRPPEDTTLIESEVVKLDIWHYNDDYLQTQQLVQVNNDLRRSYLSVYDLEKKSIRQLGSPEIQQVIQTNEGDGDTFIGVTDYGKRKEGQWLGATRKDIYAIDVNKGTKKMVKQNLHGQVYPSSSGKFILWYDRPVKNYFVWDGTSVKNISDRIKVPLYNEKYDNPDAPSPYGLMGWHEGDSAVYIYDRYDIWKIFLTNTLPPQNVFSNQKLRTKKTTIRYLQTNPDERIIKSFNSYFFRLFNENYKSSVIWKSMIHLQPVTQLHVDAGFTVSAPVKSSGTNKIIFTKENYVQSPDLYLNDYTGESGKEIKLSSLNPQQKDYLWGTAELFKWKTFSNKESSGILYKPENFNPTKKYPVLIYFYEELSDGLNEYIEPAPPRSSINVTYFISNGYVVFYPDIRYGTGHPGKDAYDFVVSGAKALIAKYNWVDANHIGIQGHSWGGYQVSYLITRTNMFKAAWAGAPVVNMTSAYGGIRYGTGVNRQFQYERGQSRIGKNLWEALPQYIESSPLFSLNKVTTPVVILHNDNDDAVPYTQGLEMFTALRRLNKKAWFICYNGEPHGVMQRKNRKDLAIRFEQYFGWLLKDEKPARWLTEGVPAIKKGKDWGLEID
jgi:acetyl esterase/lipase